MRELKVESQKSVLNSCHAFYPCTATDTIASQPWLSSSANIRIFFYSYDILVNSNKKQNWSLKMMSRSQNEANLNLTHLYRMWLYSVILFLTHFGALISFLNLICKKTGFRIWQIGVHNSTSLKVCQKKGIDSIFWKKHGIDNPLIACLTFKCIG